MADNSVFIAGAADGALAEALNGLPPWATEETAAQIQAILQRTYNLQSKSFTEMVKKMNAAGMKPEELKKANDEFEDLVKNLKDENKQYPSRRRFWKDEEIEAQRSRKRWSEAKQNHSVLMATLGMMSAWGASIKTVLTSNLETFDQLYAAGVNVVSGIDGASNGFEALQQMATLTGVRYTELAKTIEKYSTAVNTYGTGRFIKTMTAASAELRKFGFTTKESGDLLGSYLESQRGFNDVSSKTQAEVQKDLVRFGERITKLSLATGTARNKLLENVEALSQSIEANLLAGQVGNDAASSTLEFISSFQDKSLGQAFLKMMTDAIKPLNETFMDFQKTGFGGFGQKLMNFTQSLEGLSPEEAAKRTADFAKANDAELKMMLQRGNLLRQAGVREADGMLKVITGLQQQGRTYKEVSAEEKARLERTSKISKDFASAWERFQSLLQQTFINNIDVLNIIVNSLNKFADGIRWLNSFDITKSIAPFVAVGLAAVSVLGGFKLVSAGLDFLGRKLFDVATGSGKGGRNTNKGRTPAGKPSRIPGVVKGAGAGAIAAIGLDYAADELKEAGHETASAAADIASSAATFASAGAVLGSIIPGIGTAIGAGAGAAIGAGYGTYKNWNNIMTPKASVIESPSAEISKAETPPDAIPKTDSKPLGTGTEIPGNGSEINSLLRYQSSILEQILLSNNTLVSTNKDILKFTRVRA